MAQTLIDLIDIMEMYQYGFMLSSLLAIVILIYTMNKNPKKRGYAYFALIYFVMIFIFYFLRLFNIPADPIFANLFSNFIRTLGAMFIFYIAYSLMKE